MGATNLRRLAVDRGPVVTAGADIVLFGNWGAAPTLAVTAGSNDQRGTVTVTPDTGATGTLGWVLTFREAWATPPFALVNREGAGAAQPSVAITVSTMTVTQGGALILSTPIPYDYMIMG